MPVIPSDRRNRVFIGGIGDRVTKEDIETEFGRFGKLTNVWVAQNPPGFAFVEYDHISEAEMAVNEMNGKPFLGSANKIRVEHSHGGKSRPNNRRGPGNGRFDGGPRSFGGGGPRGFNNNDGGYRNNGGGFRRINRDGGNFGGNGGGRFDGGDKRRPFPPGGNSGGRFPSGGGGGGPPRYGRNDRPYGGAPRRSRSPNGRSQFSNRFP